MQTCTKLNLVVNLYSCSSTLATIKILCEDKIKKKNYY